jgi:hypothetical protein
MKFPNQSTDNITNFVTDNITFCLRPSYATIYFVNKPKPKFSGMIEKASKLLCGNQTLQTVVLTNIKWLIFTSGESSAVAA